VEELAAAEATPLEHGGPDPLARCDVTLIPVFSPDTPSHARNFADDLGQLQGVYIISFEPYCPRADVVDSQRHQ